MSIENFEMYMKEFATPEIYRTLLEGLPTGIYLEDGDHTIHFWNSGAERITGYLSQEIIGRSLPENTFSTSASAEMITQGENSPLTAVMLEGRPVQFEAYLRHRKGHSIPVSLRAIPIRDADGKVIGAAACFDEAASASEWNRRQDKLAKYGCLDNETGAPNHEFIQTQLRESLDEFEKGRDRK